MTDLKNIMESQLIKKSQKKCYEKYAIDKKDYKEVLEWIR